MLFFKYSFYTILLVISITFLGCEPQKEKVTTTVLAISKVSMSKDIDGKVGSITDVLNANDQTFHCLVQTNKIQSDAKITATLIAVSAENYENFEVRTLTQTTDSINTNYDFPFSLARTWFKGSYRCDIYLNDSLAEVKNFKIQ